ncbi:MAG: hypothetical protein K6E49_07840 [Lachnospiraceae bacterium]|nr:hypothetical protein [Lachnospiraceae bacterium]
MAERTIKLSDLKNKVAHRNSTLKKEDLENVTGGFLETRGGYANGTEVWCPRCGYDEEMVGEVDYEAGVDWFWCPVCRAYFADNGSAVWY